MPINVYLINAILLLISSVLLINVKEKGVVIKTIFNAKIRLCDAVFVFFWSCLLFFEYGLRGDFTSDYEHYQNWFYLFRNYTFSQAIHYRNVEKGFALLNAAIGFFTDDYQHYIFILGVISVSLFMVAIWRNADNRWLPIIVFVASGFYYGGWNLNSQFLAASIFSLAIGAVYKKEPIKYAIIVMLAFSIHKSALVMLPIYFVMIWEMSPKKWKKIIDCLTIICIAMTPFIGKIAIIASRLLYKDLYLDSVGMSYGWTYVVKCLSMILLLFYYRRCLDFSLLKDRVNYFGSIVYGILILWSINNAFIQRFSYYFIIFPMIALSTVFVKKGKSKSFWILLVFYFFAMQVGWFGSDYYLCFG